MPEEEEEEEEQEQQFAPAEFCPLTLVTTLRVANVYADLTCVVFWIKG